VRVVSAIKAAIDFVRFVRADVQEIESPLTGERRNLATDAAPLTEVAARAVERNVTSLVRGLRFDAALRVVDDVVLINHVALSDWHGADEAIHIAMPPILTSRSQREDLHSL
jgi:hypothetical protein